MLRALPINVLQSSQEPRETGNSLSPSHPAWMDNLAKVTLTVGGSRVSLFVGLMNKLCDKANLSILNHGLRV